MKHVKIPQGARLLIVLLAVALSACSSSGQPENSAQSSNTTAPSVQSPATAATYKNFVFDHNGGDIQSFKDSSGWYYGYYPQKKSVYVLKSKDLVSWTYIGEVYNNAGDEYGGQSATGIWAPEVHLLNGKYYLYYASVMTGGAEPDTAGNKDIVVVESSDPVHFDKANRTVLLDNNYAFIDPHVFQDTDGRLYLYNKYRGERGTGSELQGRAMSDPKTVNGDGITLLSNKDIPQSIGIGQMEQPSVYVKNGTYELFFSFGDGALITPKEGYKVMYAKATSPLGPYELGANSPLMKTNPSTGVYAPGATSIVLDGQNNEWMVYRQKKDSGKVRDLVLCIDRVTFDASGNAAVTATRNKSLPAPVFP
jgi:arabinan endo-1,5-alpha-L-arabinosidase